MGKVCEKYLFELFLRLWFKFFGLLDENFLGVFRTAFNVSSGRLSGKKDFCILFHSLPFFRLSATIFGILARKWSRIVETWIYLSRVTFWEKAEWCKRIHFIALRIMGRSEKKILKEFWRHCQNRIQSIRMKTLGKM